MSSTDMTPELWERVQELFDRMLESSDALATAAEESDARVRQLASELWDNHVRASGAGFLDRPITLVRNISGASEPRFAEGRVLNSRFAIERVLGQGGMGEVYLAFDQRLGARVAIKTIRSHLAGDVAVRARFLAEVRNARQVTHPCVCRIFDLFEEGDTPFFSMEYVEGVRLSEWLSGPQPGRRIARRIARELAEGLHAAHLNGIIHCDFKPANVLLTGDPANPHAVITDFGLARALSTAGTPNVHSLQAGTLDYMAPELLAGGAASVASDVFAYGKVLAQLLPGNRWAAACSAARVEGRPKSLEPVVESLMEGLSRRTLMVGAAAATGLAAIGGYELWRRPRPQYQRLVINGFRASGYEEDRAISLRRLLITALRQSALVSVVPDDRLRSVLRTLRKPPNLPAEHSSMVAVAASVGTAWFLEGLLEPDGSGLRAILQVFEPGRESVFLKLQERVDDPRDLVDLADHAARQLRKELGESERSLGSSTPLKQITSESPEAVNYYLQGVTAYERADPQQAAALFEQAVRLDAKFALAHLELGSALVTQGRKATALVAFRKAYDLKTRVTARESLFIEFRYQNIIGDFDGALATCRNLVALFPEEPLFQRNVAFFLVRIGAASEALPYNQRAVALDASDNNLSELIANTAEAGLYDEALNWHDQFRKEGYSSLLLNWGAGLASMGKGDYEKARANFENLGANPEQDRFSRLIRCGPLAMQGRFAEASSFLKGDIAYDSAQGEEEYLQWRRSWLAWLHVLMDAPELARQQTVELARLEVSPVWLSSLCEAAMLVSVLRDAEMGAQILDKLRQIARDWPSKHSHGARAVAEGIMSDFAGDPAAGDRFVEAMAFWPDATVRMIVAPWWRRQRNPEAALAALQPLADHPVRVMKYLFPGLMVLTWCEQARSLAAMSRFDEARRVYNRVLNHWSAGAGRFSIVRAVQKELLQLPQSKETRQHG